MGRTSCMSCGATVDVARVEGESEFVPLEVNTDSSSEADRYRIVGMNPLIAERVAKNATGDFFPDHRFDCPATRSDSVSGRV